ncbi:MAG: hypothetical protein QM660_09025 [Dysgonomonas sp.]
MARKIRKIDVIAPVIAIIFFLSTVRNTTAAKGTSIFFYLIRLNPK